MKQFLTISIQIFIFSVGICFSQTHFNWEYTIDATTRFSFLYNSEEDTTRFSSIFGKIIRPATSKENVTSIVIESNNRSVNYFFLSHDKSENNIIASGVMAIRPVDKRHTILDFYKEGELPVAQIIYLDQQFRRFVNNAFCVDCDSIMESTKFIKSITTLYGTLYLALSDENGISTVSVQPTENGFNPVLYSQKFNSTFNPPIHFMSEVLDKNMEPISGEFNQSKNSYALILGNNITAKNITNSFIAIRYFDTSYTETASFNLLPEELGYPNDTLFPLMVHHVANEVVVTGSVRHQGMMYPFVCYFDAQGNKIRHSVIPKDTKILSSTVSKDNSSVLLIGGRAEETNPNASDFYVANFNAKTREYSETIWGQADSNDRLGDVYANTIDSVYITGGTNNNLYVANIRLTVPVSVHEPQNQTDNSTLSIYPNPSKDFITVSFSNTFEHPEIVEILSIDGTVMFSQKLSENSSENAIQLSVSNFPSGSYVLNVRSKNNDVRSKSFVIER